MKRADRISALYDVLYPIVRTSLHRPHNDTPTELVMSERAARADALSIARTIEGLYGAPDDEPTPEEEMN